MSALVRLYPAAWRARYGSEFETLLAERPPSARDLVDILLGAIDARVSPQVTTAPGTPAPLSSRVSGGSAILGGLLWCVVIALAAVNRSEGNYTLPIFTAIGLMLFSLPGRYMRRYARSIVLGVSAAGLSFAILYAQILPWGLWLLLPIVFIAGALGPGAFALAAARAGIGSGARWRLVALVMPWPVIGVVLTASGLASGLSGGLVLATSLMPLGIAWMFTGARIAAGKGSTSMTITGGLA
jgi:hypothetical protein